MGRFWFGVRMAAAVMAVVAGAFSCQEPPVVTPSKGLTLSENKTVAFDETSASLRITASVDWSLYVDPGSNWLSPNATSGAAQSTTTVTFKLDKNNTEESRTGRVRILASGEAEPYYFTVTQNSPNTLTGVNKWIYDELSKSYYWNSAITTLRNSDIPLNTPDYKKFMQELVAKAYNNGARDTSENPATIDGGFDLNGDRYYYSNITRISDGTRSPRSASESVDTTFGFDFQIVSMLDRNNQPSGFYRMIVTWVREDSPAEKAGMKRGTWITKYNGAEINDSRLAEFWNQVYFLDGGNMMTIAVDIDGDRTDDDSYPIVAAEMTISPILYHDVITSERGKKVAYLMYNGFERGDDGEFDTELQTVFGEFKSAGAQALVLDLRYNPGGYVSSSQLLSSLAANVDRGKVFAKMKRNSSTSGANPQVLNFRSEPNSLKLDVVYVLATEDSASASEMVINSLRGVGIEVVHIGAKTEGKNVGMDRSTTTIDGAEYEMWPITFKILNYIDFCDYAGGFEPNYNINEFRDALLTGGILYELGDKRERLLNAALSLIDGKTISSDPQTRVAETTSQLVTKPRDPRRGGAKYGPHTQQ